MRIATPLLILLLLPFTAKADTIVEISADVQTAANLDTGAGTFEANYLYDVTTETVSDLTYELGGALSGFVYVDGGHWGLDFVPSSPIPGCGEIVPCDAILQLDFEDHDEPFPEVGPYYGPWDVEFDDQPVGISGYVTVADPTPEPSESILLAIGLMGLLAGCVFLKRPVLYSLHGTT